MVDTPKQRRGRKKATLTRHLNSLRRHITEEDVDAIKEDLRKAKEAFTDLETVHYEMHDALESVEEQEESDTWFGTVLSEYTTLVKESKTMLKTLNGAPAPMKTPTPDSSDLITLLNAPKLQIDTFAGNPADYKTFIGIFNEIVDKTSLSEQAKLTRLLQCTAGDAKLAIKNCALVGGKEGYDKALDILKKRFGDPILISRTVIDNLTLGKSVNAKELVHLSDEISTAFITLQQLGMLEEIDTQRSILSIIQRCPNFVRSKWRKKSLAEKEKNGKYLKFKDFSEFMVNVAVEVSDPVYGNESYFSKTTQRQGRSSMQAHVAPVSIDKRVNHVCSLCKSGEHKLYTCKTFRDLNISDRIKFVRDNRMCFNCFGHGHRAGDCKFSSNCSSEGCNFKHSKLLHVDKNPVTNTLVQIENTSDSDSSETECKQVIHSAVGNSGFGVSCVPMVEVLVNNSFKAWALLDTGSTNTFITENLASRLNLKGTPVKYHMNTISDSIENSSVLVNIKVSSMDNKSYGLNNVMVVKHIPAKFPSSDINLKDYPFLDGLPFPKFSSNNHAEILIGVDNAHLMKPIKVISDNAQNSPYAILTVFGWTICGPIQGSSFNSHVASFCVGIESKVKSLWDIEVAEEDKYSPSVMDKYVLDLWNKNITFDNGHYCLPIPFKNTTPDFPDNRFLAEKRLNSLNHKLRSMNLFEKYEQNIRTFLQQGYAEQVPDSELRLMDGSVWYLPHHPVLNDKKPGKVRTVFDCAAEFKNVSLNNQCLRGPDLTNKLIDVLLKFRQYEYAVTADVECMYMQVKIPREDRNALRFLWNINGKITDFRMSAHLFGGVWCSSSSTFALRQCTIDFPCSDAVRDAICHGTYVDDLLKSCKTRSEAIEIALGCKTVLKSAGFNLTKFVSNYQEILNALPDNDLAPNTKSITTSSQGTALGIKWDISKDAFLYDYDSICVPALTRRAMLSQLSTLFDPLGLVSPIILSGKIMFQETSRRKLSWDDSLPPDVRNGWCRWLKSLVCLADVSFPRCVCPPEFADSIAELHIFSDASQSAYGAVAYIRFVNRKGMVHVSLLTSKTRLAPLKQLTIPRLELCAAVLAVNLEIKVKQALQLDLLPSTFWTDSTIVLGYIGNETRRFKTFVGNRVAIIREYTRPEYWNHVKSGDNIADIASRGCKADSLPGAWVEGPTFLSSHKSAWINRSLVKYGICDSDPEIKRDIGVCAEVIHDPEREHPLDSLINYYSSYYRLKKAVAGLIKLARYFKKGGDCVKLTEPLTASEIRQGEISLIKHVQSKCYIKELKSLKLSDKVLTSSPIAKLSPEVDQSGVLTVGGRLKHSTMPLTAKHPMLLPACHRLSRLIVSDRHNEAHLGVEWLISDLRSKFWITQIRPLVKSVKHSCMICKRLYAPTHHQKMGDLLSCQVEPGRPAFSYTGLDVFGPFYVRQGRSEVKRYGCIYTCLTTRAVHIEVLPKLDTDSFLNGFFRFVSRRGKPEKVFSDNGTNIVGARNELKRCMKDLKRVNVVAAAAKKDIDWSFNPPRASHMGGIWERMIRSVRRVLCAVLDKNVRLSDDILHTVMCTVENIINNRPITRNSTDINDDKPLTPNHLLLHNQNDSTSIGVFFSSDLYRKRWRSAQVLIERFWKKWSKHYVSQLQVRTKWQSHNVNFKAGDLVLVETENSPRGVWPLALITEVKRGRDGLVRSVTLKTKDNHLVRPITKLVLLEGHCSER